MSKREQKTQHDINCQQEEKQTEKKRTKKKHTQYDVSINRSFQKKINQREEICERMILIRTKKCP